MKNPMHMPAKAGAAKPPKTIHMKAPHKEHLKPKVHHEGTSLPGHFKQAPSVKVTTPFVPRAPAKPKRPAKPKMAKKAKRAKQPKGMARPA